MPLTHREGSLKEKLANYIKANHPYVTALLKCHREQRKRKGSSHMLKQGLADRKDDLQDQISQKVLRNVASLYAACKRHEADLPPAYQVEGEWKSYLSERASLYTGLENKGPEEFRALLTNFWRHEFLGRYTGNRHGYYFQVAASRSREKCFLDGMLADYESWRRYSGGDVHRLRAPHYGNAWGISMDGVLVVPQAFRLHPDADNILGLLDLTAQPVVAEIGGGYGGMAYYLLSQRKDLTYINIDIAETLFLSAFYLSRAFPERRIYYFTKPEPITAALISQYDLLFLPHYMLPQIDDLSVDLFHNAVSLSEMSRETVAEYLHHIQRTTSHLFYHINVDQPGVTMRADHERLVASQFPIDRSSFRQLYRNYHRYFGPTGIYSEFLFERRPD